MVLSTLLNPRFLASFSRAQAASLAGSIVDFGFLFIATELLHVWYVISVAVGAFLGALTNFLINRHWTFDAAKGNLSIQAGRYCLVSTISLILNTGGVYLLTEYSHVHYAISVFVISIAVGFLFNYPMHRHYVYRM